MCIRSAEGLRRASALAALAAAWMGVAAPAGAQGYPTRFDFGAPATPEEIAAVAIAIPPDGKGLPPGRGTYEQGKEIYVNACAACHGADLKGVTGLRDMPQGAQLRLVGGRGTLTQQKPVVTVESYWPYATTLFDYIRRAMPFQSPGILSADEIYAVCAYILAEANIIDNTTALDAETLPKVRMPNREGFVPDARPEIFK